ncbi:MAG: alginate lyase family protein [Clostridium sp.]|nr:alginate lyase family protein [Clostridium sp.]
MIFAAAAAAMAAQAREFVHPGVLHTDASIERMKALVDAKVEPAYGSYQQLRDHECSQADYKMYGPFKTISRDGEYAWTKTKMEHDFSAAYQNSLMWAITGDERHARKALDVLLGYANTLETIPSTNDAPLLVGLEGLKIAYAAEMLKHTYPGITKKDMKAIDKMAREKFIPVMEKFYATPAYTNGNWGPIVTKAYMAFAILWDDEKMYDKAVDFYLHANDNGTIENYIDGATGQIQESGRDQGHAQLGIAAMATICEMAWKQGTDLYSALDNRLLKGFEYTAKYNLGEDVPFKTWADVTGKYAAWPMLSEESRGQFKPVYEMVWNHYAVRKGLPMPYTERVLAIVRPEGYDRDQPAFGSLLFNDWSKTEGAFDVDEALAYCHGKVKQALGHWEGCADGQGLLPVIIENGDSLWACGSQRDWRLGFWPGILWMDYKATGDRDVALHAEKCTDALEFLSQKKAGGHDLGFLVYCAYGKELECGNPSTAREMHCRKVIMDTADTLATLYSDKVGTICSWPNNRQFAGHNTIIDNMMNLELMFRAGKMRRDRRMTGMAARHAATTMANHFREDGSAYHVVVYDPETGQPVRKATHQGYADESMWARGQAWAIYGFTMAYRETGNKHFLDQARKSAKIYLDRLPEDHVPYWDFDAPANSDTPRDASAAAVTASALLELAGYVEPEAGAHYTDAAAKMLASLSSQAYRSGDANDAFLLHSTGHHPAGKEIDSSLTYADYYYLEALLRLKKLKEGV